MKAITYDRFGPPEVLQPEEVIKPVPKDNEVLVKIHAATVTYGDITARNFANLPYKTLNMPLPFMFLGRLSFGLLKPKIRVLGNEFAGEIEAIGKNVNRFKKGDAVYGCSGASMGTYAEYVCIAENKSVAKMPAGMTYEEAAAVPGGAITALNVLKKITLKPGKHVLINGASGGIGSAALQIVKNQGAVVTGTCSTPKMEYVKTLGADRVIDYTKEDFTQGKETYDLIIDVLGKCPFSRAKKVLKPSGICLYTSFKTVKLLLMLLTAASKKKALCVLAIEKPGDLEYMNNLIQEGKYKTIIARSYTLNETQAAHRYLESGQAAGKVTIRVTERASLSPLAGG